MVACFSSANLPNLDNYLLNFDFCHLSCASSGDECWSQLKSAIVNASLLFVPRVRVPCNPLVDTFEHRCSTDVLYLDIRKAFDSVPHQELLFKLWRIGITGKLWFWFKAYLSNRLHFVHYKGFHLLPFWFSLVYPRAVSSGLCYFLFTLMNSSVY